MTLDRARAGHGLTGDLDAAVVRALAAAVGRDGPRTPWVHQPACAILDENLPLAVAVTGVRS